MKLSPKSLLAAITLPALITACSSNGDEVQQITSQDLQHHNWELVSVDGKEVIIEGREQTPRLEIGEKMMANGNAGCNNFFGQAELNDNKLRIDKMGMTMKMCVGEAMEVEKAFSQTLTEWSNVTLNKDTLTLQNEVHTLTFKLNDWKS